MLQALASAQHWALGVRCLLSVPHVQVPELTTISNEKLAQYHSRLVRLRMLVVETLDPEVYPGAVQTTDGSWVTGKYGNDLSAGGPSMAHCFWERRPVRVKPLPGLSPWCADISRFPGAQ